MNDTLTTADIPPIPTPIRHRVPRALRRWATGGNRKLDCACLEWPEFGFHSLLIFERVTGITEELIALHYLRAILPYENLVMLAEVEPGGHA